MNDLDVATAEARLRAVARALVRDAKGEGDFLTLLIEEDDSWAEVAQR